MSLPREILHDEARFAERAYGRQLENADATINFQRDIIARLQFQLANAQNKLGMTPHDVADAAKSASEQVDANDLPPWYTDPDIMMPLLVAYDSRIQELESSNKGLVDAVMSSRTKLEEITKENENLRGEIGNRAVNTAQTSQKPSWEASTAGDLRRTAELEEIAQLSSEEAKTLRDEVSLLMREVNALRAAVEERDSALLGQMRQYKALVASFTQAQEALKGVDSERRMIEQELLKMTSQLGEAQREREMAHSAAMQSRRSLDEKVEQLRDYRKAIEELTNHANKEAELWLQRNRLVTDRCQELKAQLEDSNGQLSYLKDQLRAAEQELTTTKADAEGMLQVISRLEEQLAELKQAEGRARAAEEMAANSVQAMAVERDQAVAKEAQARRELARVLERRRVEIGDAQAHEADALAQTRARLTAQIAARDEEISKLRESVVTAGAVVDRTTREMRLTQQEHSRIENNLREELAKARRENETVLEKLRLMQDARDTAQRQAREVTSSSAASVEDARHDRQQLLDRALSAENALHKSNIHVGELEARYRSLQLAHDELQRELASTRDEVQLLRRRQEGDMEQIAHRKQADVMRLEGSLAAAQDTISKLQERIGRFEFSERQPLEDSTWRGDGKFAATTALPPEFQLVQQDLVVANTIREQLESELVHMRQELTVAEDTIDEQESRIRQLQFREDAAIRDLTEARTQLEVTKLALARAAAREQALQCKVDELEASMAQMRVAAISQAGKSKAATFFAAQAHSIHKASQLHDISNVSRVFGPSAETSPGGCSYDQPSLEESGLTHVDILLSKAHKSRDQAVISPTVVTPLVVPPASQQLRVAQSAAPPSPKGARTESSRRQDELSQRYPDSAVLLDEKIKAAQQKLAQIAATAMSEPVPSVQVPRTTVQENHALKALQEEVAPVSKPEQLPLRPAPERMQEHGSYSVTSVAHPEAEQAGMTSSSAAVVENVVANPKSKPAHPQRIPILMSTTPSDGAAHTLSSQELYERHDETNAGSLGRSAQSDSPIAYTKEQSPQKAEESPVASPVGVTLIEESTRAGSDPIFTDIVPSLPAIAFQASSLPELGQPDEQLPANDVLAESLISNLTSTLYSAGSTMASEPRAAAVDLKSDQNDIYFTMEDVPADSSANVSSEKSDAVPEDISYEHDFEVDDEVTDQKESPLAALPQRTTEVTASSTSYVQQFGNVDIAHDLADIDDEDDLSASVFSSPNRSDAEGSQYSLDYF